jgi:hypothetical protein
VFLDESIDGTAVFAPDTNQVHSGDTFAVTARYFRLNVTGGYAGGTFRASVRSLA